MRRDLGIAALIVGVLVLTYLPVVRASFAVTDDWGFLAYSLRGSGWSHESVASGRPLLAVAVLAGFKAASSHADLRWLRLVGIVAIGLLSYLLYRVAARAGWPWWKAAVLGLCVCATPPFQVFASWAITFALPISAALAVLAYLAAQRAAAEGRWLLAAGGVLLLAAAGTIYQVTMMFFLVPLALDVFRPRGERVPPRLLATAAAVLAGGLALGFAIYKLGVVSLPHLVHPGRAQLSFDWAAKLEWFVRDPLTTALHLWHLFPRPGLPSVIAALIAVGLLLYFRGGLLERLGQLGLAAALVVASYTPNLLITESWAAYRTLAVVTSMVVVLAFLALHGFLERLGRSVLLVGLLLGAELALLSAHRNVTRYYVWPQTFEKHVMLTQFLSTDLTRVTRLFVVGTHWSDSISDLRFDEHGIASSSRPWAVEPMVWVLARDVLGRPPWFEIVVRDEPPPHLRPGAHVIDMRGLRARAGL